MNHLPVRQIVGFGICWLAASVAHGEPSGDSEKHPLVFPPTGVPQAAVVPGTGQKVADVGDDFEDPSWLFDYNLPKSSSNLDHQVRSPGGRSRNGRWSEAALRGEPDVVKRVPTPEGGLPGSTGALLLQTKDSGIPGSPSHQVQQDDFLSTASSHLGGSVSVSRTPSVVVRVFLPPFDQWEAHTGNSFGFRCAVRGSSNEMRPSRWGNSRGTKVETYWPGMFICLYSKADPKYKEDSAAIVIRGDLQGADYAPLRVSQLGWWTLGMSFTPDGQVHYFAKPGVENLTSKDLVASQWAYAKRAEAVETFFFDLMNMDDGKTWSTPWIIDDPAMYTQSR